MGSCSVFFVFQFFVLLFKIQHISIVKTRSCYFHSRHAQYGIGSSFARLQSSLETLRSRFGHVTANDKLRLGVNGFTLPFYPYLGLTPILAEKLSSKLRFLKQISIINKQKSSKRLYFFSNVGLLFQGAKKPCGRSLTSGALSSHTNVNLKPQNLTAKPQSGDFLTFAVREKFGKTSVLRFLN